MYSGNPRYIRRRVYAALVLTHLSLWAAACAVLAIRSGERARLAQQAFGELFEAVSHQAADLQSPRDLQTLRDWTARTASFPGIALLAVYDEADKPLAVAGKNGRLRKALADLWERRPSQAYGTTAVRLTGRPTAELPYASTKVTCNARRPTYLGLLLIGEADPDYMPPWSARAWAKFYMPLIGAGTLVVLAALVWVDRWALDPLRRFLNIAHRIRRAQKLPVAQTESETMGALLKSVEVLQAKSDAWRDEAKQLSVTFDRRVDAMSRYITRELRTAFKQAATDPLTGLGNRRVLEENLGALIAQSVQADADLSAILFDLDYFKTINDHYGHAHGDEVLCFVGDLLSGCLREDDIAVRMGGDEFVLLLPGVGPKEAQKIALRLTALFRQHCSGYELRRPLSMSAGVVSLKDFPTRDPNEFLEMADRALYAAKEAGRDGVVVLSTGLMTRVVMP